MPHTSNNDWIETAPAVSEVVGLGAAELKYLRGGVRIRLRREHKEFATSGVGGEHLQGSAISYFGEYTGEDPADEWPTMRPDGATNFTEDDLGRLLWDTAGEKFYVLTAIDPTWTQVGLYGGQISQVEGVTDISNTTADWADMSDMSQVITTKGGDIILTFVGTIRVAGILGLRFTSKIGVEDEISYCVQAKTTDEGTPGGLLSMSYLITGLDAGEYTFKVQWKDTTGTVYQYGSQCPRIFIVEEKLN